MIYKLLSTRVYRAYYGGENIDKITDVENPSVTRFPEDWIGSVTTAFNPDRNVENEGLTKTTEGEFLKDIIEKDKENMIGNRNQMSLLFKMLDSNERLAIQVHPTVEFAKEYFNSPFGKTECWYILNDGGYVYIGFKPGITKEYMKELFDKQDTDGMLNAMHRFEVKKGDFIYVAGGVPHAIGAGCFMAELQEPTDLMVIPERVTPSGIKLAEAKLHGGLGFEKMFDCFSYRGFDRETTYKKYFVSPQQKDRGLKVIADSKITDKFRLYEIATDNEYIYSMDSYGIVLIVEGEGKINDIPLKQGDRLFVSESEGKLHIKGNLKCLICQP